MQHCVQTAALDATLAQLQPPKLTDAQVLALAFLVPQELLLSALELIDTSSVHRITTPYGGTLYTVSGTSHPYLLGHAPSKSAYCPCAAFAFSLVAGGGADELAGLCKHLLALRIALRLDLIVEERLDGVELPKGEEKMLKILESVGVTQ